MANYRKAYLCICDGQQEKMYLDHVAIRKFIAYEYYYCP